MLPHLAVPNAADVAQSSPTKAQGSKSAPNQWSYCSATAVVVGTVEASKQQLATAVT